MLRCAVLVFCAVFCTSLLPAQQLGVYSIYRDNFQLINPAAMNHFYITSDGNPHNIMFNVALRQQWIGVEGAPRSFNARFEQAPSNVSMKYGLFFSYDEVFANSNLGLYGNYAYFINLIRPSKEVRQLVFGLNAGLVQQRFDLDLIRFDQPEALLSDNRVYADFALGMFFFSRNAYDTRIYAGVSTLQAFSINLIDTLSQSVFAEDRVQHIYALAGGVFPLNNESLLEPSVWVRYTPNTSYASLVAGGFPFSIDANIRYQLVESRVGISRKRLGFWVGAGASTTRELKVELGGLQIVPGKYATYKVGIAYNFYLPGRITLGPTVELNGSFSL